jgi:hypothetical protein
MARHDRFGRSISGVDVTGEVTREALAGRVRLRPNRGLPPSPAPRSHPTCPGRPLHRPATWLRRPSPSHLPHGGMVRHDRFGRSDDRFPGLDVTGEVTRETLAGRVRLRPNRGFPRGPAPRPHPTCPGRPLHRPALWLCRPSPSHFTPDGMTPASVNLLTLALWWGTPTRRHADPPLRFCLRLTLPALICLLWPCGGLRRHAVTFPLIWAGYFCRLCRPS